MKTLEARQKDDEDRLHAWRLLQFRELGCEEQDAALLAWSRADIGRAREYIAQGCKPELLPRILT